MIIPVRCFSCGKVIGHLWKQYEKSISEYGELIPPIKESEKRCMAMDKLGLTRYCCRTMFLGHVELANTLIQYSNNPGEKLLFRKK